jgi:alpha-L-rhamnosidase
VPVRARLYVTALGAYEVDVNGVRVGDEVLAPGWTSYRDRVLVQSHDVTDLVRPGVNTVGAWLAGAWFTERYGFFGRAARAYEGPAAFLAPVELTYADGTRRTVATGLDWEGSTAGPLRSSGIYAGEEFDATRHDPAWSTPSGSADGWAPAVVRELEPRGPLPRRCRAGPPGAGGRPGRGQHLPVRGDRRRLRAEPR